jgi:hypothetical protein
MVCIQKVRGNMKKLKDIIGTIVEDAEEAEDREKAVEESSRGGDDEDMDVDEARNQEIRRRQIYEETIPNLESAQIQLRNSLGRETMKRSGSN